MTITEKIHKRMLAAEKLRNENISQLNKLNKKSPAMLENLNMAINAHSKAISEDPGNKQLQREYSTMILSRQMVRTGYAMNEKIMENEQESN